MSRNQEDLTPDGIPLLPLLPMLDAPKTLRAFKPFERSVLSPLAAKQKRRLAKSLRVACDAIGELITYLETESPHDSAQKRPR